MENRAGKNLYMSKALRRVSYNAFANLSSEAVGRQKSKREKAMDLFEPHMESTFVTAMS